MADPLIRMEAADLGYGPNVVLGGVNPRIEDGDALGPVGPNGSGKITLLRAIRGLLKPLAGDP